MYVLSMKAIFTKYLLHAISVSPTISRLNGSLYRVCVWSEVWTEGLVWLIETNITMSNSQPIFSALIGRGATMF